MSYGPQGQLPPPPSPYIEAPRAASHGLSAWELIVAGFWLGLGFMASSVAVVVGIAAILLAIGLAGSPGESGRLR